MITFKKRGTKRLEEAKFLYVENIFLIAISTLTKFTSYCKDRVETLKAAVITIK